VLLERQLDAPLLRLDQPRADRLDPRLGRGELALALWPRLRRRLEPARAPFQLPQLAEPRLRLLMARAVVLGGQRGQLGAQLLEPLLALAAVGAQRVELLYGPLAALEAARLLLDGGAHGRAPRLRLRQVVRLLAELLLALAQPLAVLHQRLPLVAQAREHALELRAQRPFAGRADALGPRLLQHPHLLLQLLPALAVRLEPRPHLLLLLHPVGKPIADLLLGRDQLALRLLQLTAVLLGERGCLLDRGEPPLTISQLAQQRFLAVQQRAPPLHQPRALRQLLALLHHGG